MRRGLSIFLVLVFGLGPLAAALPASEESRLPPCCRRHGSHHCAMSMHLAAMQAAQAASGGTPLVSAPSHCPLFPDSATAPTTPVHALAAAPASLPMLLARPQSPAASPAAARLSQLRTRSVRGPPASPLA